ncbi:N-acetylglucosamine/diacetylchitobiose ABC transporter substrate-binding protein [Virgibacillus siamensis]|uniref:N-acetylglucosamine/diacetylchitobiose ABC transporter substrate-binding protein n=1 Tax=Virgibacillus siamensis TaxID=480071 RepID=A0ABN1FG19_9BACI
MRKVFRGPLLLACLTGIILVAMVGCSSENDSSDDSASETKNDGKVNGTLEIQYFVGGYGDEWWKEVISTFKEKYPEVKVVEHAGPNVNDEMKTRWIANNPPDVIYIDGDGANETQMIKDNQLMDISDWVNELKLEDGTPLMDSFISPPEVLEGDKIYSLPLVFDTWGVWYDSAWFEEQGFDVPDDFPSWLSSMKEIKAKTGIHPFITTGKYPQYFLRGILYPAFSAAGGEKLLNNLMDGKLKAWESEKTLEVFKKVEKVQEAGLIDPGFAARSHTQTQMNFLMHDNAYIPVGFWLPKEMEKDIPEGFEYGFIPTPMNSEGDSMALVPDLRPVAIAKKADNPEAAKAFVKFIFTKENAQKFAESTGAIMNLRGVNLSKNEKVPQFLKDINEIINNPGKVEMYDRKTPEEEELEIAIEVSDKVKSMVVPLLLGKINAEEFVEEMQGTVKQLRNK